MPDSAKIRAPDSELRQMDAEAAERDGIGQEKLEAAAEEHWLGIRPRRAGYCYCLIREAWQDWEFRVAAGVKQRMYGDLPEELNQSLARWPECCRFPESLLWSRNHLLRAEHI